MSESGETVAEQGFLSHLIELRDRLLRMVIAIGVVFLCFFPFAKDLFDWLAYPLASQLPADQGLIIIGPAAPVLVPYKLALLAAFLVALPYVLYQFWSFVAPGLYRHEKRLAIPLLVSSVLLFYVGIAFAYYILLPLVFNILPLLAPSTATYMPDIGHYMDFVMVLFMAFGIGFEMPIATILLIATGMTTREDLAKKRPYVLVGAFTVGMLLTPPDVISQVLLAIPMWLLFEVGLLASILFEKQIARSRQERARRESEEQAAQDEDESAIMRPAEKASGMASDGVTGAATAAATAATTTATAANATADDVSHAPESMSDPVPSDPEASSSSVTNTDDPNDYYETELVNSYQENDDYRPLTDEEMEAELERMDREEQESLSDQGTRDTYGQNQKAGSSPPQKPEDNSTG